MKAASINATAAIAGALIGALAMYLFATPPLPTPDIRIAAIQPKENGLYRVLDTIVYNAGEQIAVVNGFDLELKQSWKIKGIEKPTAWGAASLHPFDIEVDTSTQTPLHLSLTNVAFSLEPNKTVSIPLVIRFSPLDQQSLTIYRASITYHCDNQPDIVVDNILISSPRNDDLRLHLTGEMAVDAAQQAENRNAAKQIGNLPAPTAPYLLPAEIQNVLSEILTPPSAG